jgi:aryl-alcohol dehydrogenase-like predicted oxidoreductase
MNPRFQGENFAKNLELVKRVTEIATARKATPAQLALAWVLGRGRDLVPIPGTRRRASLEENAAAVGLVLTHAELARLDEVAPRGIAAGTRYPEAGMKAVGL